MKELSIQEKAKRYDEALEKGKQIQNTPYTAHWDIMKEVAEHLLPELKESEGERIRKKLVQFFKEKDEEDFEEWIPKAKVLAWLEKEAKGNEREIPNSTWSEGDEI